jgi:hypothetical protein
MTDRAAGEGSGWRAARHDGERLLDAGDLDAAIARLTIAESGDGSGESRALLGLAHFRAERYAAAATHDAAAIAADGSTPEWRRMEATARANATAEVEVAVPPVRHFERDALLAPPATPTLPEVPDSGLDLHLWRRLRYIVGHAIGSVGGVVFGWLTRTFGRNYRGDVWTNWYRKRTYSGILTLAYMREKLNADNLLSSYPAGERIGLCPVPITGDTTTHLAGRLWGASRAP